MNRFYGSPVLTLDEVVNQMMIGQENNKRTHYPAYLMHGKWIWKKLLRGTLFSFRTVAIAVVNGVVQLPKDILQVVNVSVLDKDGKAQPVNFNPGMVTMDIKCPPVTCSCNTCGDKTDTLCYMLDTIQMVSEDVVINSVTYQKTTWIRKGEDGSLQSVSSVPVYDAATSSVIYVKRVEMLCDLQLDKDGCILNTENNQFNFIHHCGCYIHSFARQDWMCDAYPKEKMGEWNYSMDAEGKLQIKNLNVAKLILTYQTNGDCDGRVILIPEQAVEAVTMGILWRKGAMAPPKVVSVVEKEYNRRQYVREEEELWRWLNPIHADQFMALSSIMPKWGGHPHPAIKVGYLGQ